VVDAAGKTLQVFDLKPSDIIDPQWIQKVRLRLDLTADEIKAISYEGLLGLVCKPDLASQREGKKLAGDMELDPTYEALIPELRKIIETIDI